MCDFCGEEHPNPNSPGACVMFWQGKADQYREALAELKGAAWQFKQMIYAAHAPDGTLLASWLERTTANIRAAVPELQFKPSHERLVAAIAAADAAVNEV